MRGGDLELGLFEDNSCIGEGISVKLAFGRRLERRERLFFISSLIHSFAFDYFCDRNRISNASCEWVYIVIRIPRGVS